MPHPVTKHRHHHAPAESGNGKLIGSSHGMSGDDSGDQSAKYERHYECFLGPGHFGEGVAYDPESAVGSRLFFAFFHHHARKTRDLYNIRAENSGRNLWVKVPSHN